jgi:hypothetical protein
MGNSNQDGLNTNKGKLEDQYFSMINRIMTKKNYFNYSLTDNIKVCLSEKNFDQTSETSVQYFTLNPGEEPQNFTNWLDFIYQYLYKESSAERYWTSDMILELDNENFLSENRYLSEFFYEEFELENIPKCFIKDKIDTNVNQKINLEHSYLNVTQNLGGSFMTSSPSVQDQSGANLKYKYFRNKVNGYINKFKQHILNKDHPINKVTQIFVEIWVKYAQGKINSIKQKTVQNTDEIVENLTKELQRFIVHLQISLKLFYSRTINYSYFNEEKDELMNLITTLLFRTGNIYNTVFELYQLSMEKEIKKMVENFHKLKKIAPEELGIEKQLCLNIISLNFQEEILNNKLKEIEDKESKDNPEKKKDVGDLNNDFEFQKKKIQIILEVVRENKIKCPRYGDREIEETKVNLDYEENEDLIPANENKQDEDNKMDDEMSVRKMSLLPIHELVEEDSNLDIDEYLYDHDEENTYKDKHRDYEENNANKTLIIRTNTQKINEIKLPQMEKIFNRISYVRTKNIEYLSYPYETAIQLLKQVQKYQTPFEKMMIFASISSEITECINDFWKDLSGYIKKDLLNLEIDQLMTIFIYIIIQAQIPDICVHCKMIKSFTTGITKASMIGYYYSTVEASIQYISSVNDVKELYKNKI